MDHYKVVISEELIELQEIVNAHIEAGFVPHGSICVYGDSLIQPMVFTKPAPTLYPGTVEFGIKVFQDHRDRLLMINAKNDDPYDNLITLELLEQLINFLKDQPTKKG